MLLDLLPSCISAQYCCFSHLITNKCKADNGGEMSTVSSVSGSSYAPSNNHAKIHWGKAALEKKNISQLNSRKALNQNQITLLSQIQCEPCLKAVAPAIPALQTQPGIWPQFLALSVTCCVILDKLLLFSMTSVPHQSIGRENTPDIKDSQMTNYSKEKTQIRLT